MRTENEFIRFDQVLLVLESILFLVFSHFHVILAIKVLLSNMMHVVSPKLLGNRGWRREVRKLMGNGLIDNLHLRFILIA